MSQPARLASSSRSAIRFFCQLSRDDPSAITLVIGLMVLQTLTAGIGILFLLPLLSLLGFAGMGAAEHPVSQWVTGAFEMTGFSLSLGAILLVYMLLITLVASLRFVVQVRSSGIQQQFIHRQRNELYQLVLHGEWGTVGEMSLADLGHALTQQVQQVGRMSQLCFQFLSQVILGFGFLLVALVVSWELSALALVFFCVSSLVLLPLYRRTLASGSEQLGAHKQLFQSVTGQLHSLRMIKLFAGERHFAEHVDKISQQLEHQQQRLSRMTAMTQWLLAVSTALLVSVYFYVSMTVLLTSLPELLVLLVVLARMLPLISSLQKTVQQFLHAIPASGDITRLRAKLEERQEPRVSAGQVFTLNQQLVLQGVSFGYPSSAKPVFERFDCHVKAGSITALVGPSGVGKSTLADLVAGLQRPQAGQLICDRRLIEGLDTYHWRQCVAYVAQEPLLLNDSILNNLVWVSPESSEADVLQALQFAAADEFVKALPEGLQTLIGDHGRSLSGGQRQRLAIARALLRKPLLLILDEATNALDRENEQMVRDTLLALKGKVTVLLISHQASVLELADEVVELRGNVA